jgi:hypothetical protein
MLVMLTPEETVALVNGTPNQEHGVQAKFVPVNEDWGLKYYDSRENRDKNYDRQLSYIPTDAAPQLGDKIDFNLNGEPYYGFFTERVTVAGNLVAEMLGLSGPYQNWYDRAQKIYDYINDVAGEEVYELRKQLGHGADDLHPWNWGYTKDGRAVAIDFSHFF